MDSTQRVNRAVAVAVSAALSAQGHVENPAGFRTAVGRRIQGAYGCELRRLADAEPEATPDELYERVIVPGESPCVRNPAPRAFKQSPGPFLDQPTQPLTSLGALCELFAWIEGTQRAREALDTGRELGSLARKARREATNAIATREAP